MPLTTPDPGELKEWVAIFTPVAPRSNHFEGTQAPDTEPVRVRAKVEQVGSDMGADTLDELTCRRTYRVWTRSAKIAKLTPKGERAKPPIDSFVQLSWRGRVLVVVGMEEFYDEWFLIHAEWHERRQNGNIHI